MESLTRWTEAQIQDAIEESKKPGYQLCFPEITLWLEKMEQARINLILDTLALDSLKIFRVPVIWANPSK
jgi:hypothetical protein